MNNNNRNNSSNRNGYRELADGDKDNVGSLHIISDNSISITTVQVIAEEVKVQQLEFEIAQELNLLNTDINQVSKQVSKALSTLIDKDIEKQAFKDKGDNMTVLLTLEMEKKIQDKVAGVTVRINIKLF